MKTNSTWSLLPLIATIVSLYHIGQASAATVAAWNFENNPIAVNNNPAPSAGAGTASSIGMDVFPTPNVGVTYRRCLTGRCWRHRCQYRREPYAGLASPRCGRYQRCSQRVVKRRADRRAGGRIRREHRRLQYSDQRQLRLVRNHAGRGQSPTAIHQERRHHLDQRADHPGRVG